MSHAGKRDGLIPTSTAIPYGVVTNGSSMKVAWPGA